MAVVEHDRQYRRQPAVRGGLLAGNEIPVQQPNVDPDAQHHPAIRDRLELGQQIDVEPFVSQADLPHHVVVPRAQVVADVASVHPAQACEVSRSYPVVIHEAEQQVTHHLRGGKQTLVAAVVIVRHRHTISGKRARRYRPWVSAVRLRCPVHGGTTSGRTESSTTRPSWPAR